MPHTFMYPRVTQIAPRAHGVPASWLFPERPARASGDALGQRQLVEWSLLLRPDQKKGGVA